MSVRGRRGCPVRWACPRHNWHIKISTPLEALCGLYCALHRCDLLWRAEPRCALDWPAPSGGGGGAGGARGGGGVGGGAGGAGGGGAQPRAGCNADAGGAPAGGAPAGGGDEGGGGGGGGRFRQSGAWRSRLGDGRTAPCGSERCAMRITAAGVVEHAKTHTSSPAGPVLGSTYPTVP
eukprot:1176611-Prorocentrum_minimum.AAC.1